MGTVIQFPAERPLRANPAPREAGSVVILPVVRVERGGDEPSGGMAPQAGAPGSGGRRRPARRS